MLKNEQLMFDRRSVDKIYNHLARLLRLIMYHNKITLDQYANLYHEHARSMGKDHTKTTSGLTNERKTLEAPNISIQKFMLNLRILKFNIVRISVTVKSPYSDKEVTYHSDEKLIPTEEEREAENQKDKEEGLL